jgi:acetyl-CoA carboxylase biotin carboxyl carrier protein
MKHKTTTTPANNPGKGAVPAETVRPSTENEVGKHPSLTEIEELIEFVSKKEFNEFELELGGFRLRWRKGAPEPAAAPSNRQPANVPQPAAESRLAEFVSATPAERREPAPAPVPPEEEMHVVASPIVGTFYRSPSPTAEPFVKLGDTVEAGKTLCIIEAMKLMNEIPSDAGGIVAKIFVENGQPVEYGQSLFGIKI